MCHGNRESDGEGPSNSSVQWSPGLSRAFHRDEKGLKEGFLKSTEEEI